MKKHNIEEITQLLKRLEKEIQETKQSLRMINKSIDKYDKYSFINVS
ncbi:MULTISPECIES: degradation enzyme regulation protein DegQ [Metabacillus]|uniref:Degradation enzyme regulation protein DegQ n=1 Tax=Metabacillus indicus TaxID=246786 RepID=A0A084GKF2_METID|nr:MULTISPECIES: degradation enzyme regulation protein DegQ [Metabacillus]KEZ47814.1 Degradation enzyme regulation protein DegQ [Metabacillus indicus]KEZ48427.1 Degradation enzyme regulation protein DegQ [Metabacillus indicus LMG 22858]MDX8290260.1 degradation enzyme regulation protein DegQ [Metabacillus indicus]